MSDIDSDKQILLKELLKHVPFDGWSNMAISNSATNLGWSEKYPSILFPQGIPDILEFFHQQARKRLSENINPPHN